MADINISKFTTQVLRKGSTPAAPGFAVSEGQNPVEPSGTTQDHLPVTIAAVSDGLTITESQILSGAGTTGQYIRGDGSLASFPSLTGFVPYTGATQNVDLGEFGVDAGFVNLDTTPTNTPTTQGTIYWDDARSTAALIMNGTIQHIGQDTFFYVKNATGSSIPKGTAVRFAGTDGASGHLLITPFLANGSVPSTYFMGVTAEVIANGGFGQVMHFGELEGINTSGFTAGSLLYASTTVAGGFQTAIPVAPNNIVLIAATINSKNNGAILVRPTYGSNINTDEGVKITSPATGQLLQLQAGGLWENKTLGQVIGGTSSQFLKGDGSLDSNVYALNSALASYQLLSAKGQPNGYAGLDSNGKVPLAQINDALIGNVNFQGLWNAATNTPTLANPPAAGTKGYYYIVSTAGTFAGISFEVGDWIISDGSAWGKVDNTDAVSSVFGRTGNVTASNGDYNTSQVTENTNLYFTNARAIASVLTGYTSGAGTISAADTILSAIQKLNGNIGALVTGVSSVNGQTGVVTLTTTNIAEGTNLYYTEARVNANANVAANTAARHAAVTLGTANGLSLSTQQLSLGLASAGVTGALSGTDWSTFNSKQNALNGTGFVKISGTTISYDNSTYLTTAAAASTYLALVGGTMTGNINWTANDVGLTWSRNTDGAFIKFISVGDGAGESYLQIGTSDNGDEKIIFTQSSLIRVQVDTDGLLKNGSSQKYVFENGATWGIAISGNAGTVTNGVVTTGSYSNPSWITALSWTKITDRPTTLAGYGITDAVPSSRTITINGTAQDLSANRTFNVGTVTSVAALTLGTSGTDLSSSVANGTTTPVITLNVPTASASNRGALSAADWTTFNNKQNALTNPVTGTGTTNYIPKFTGTSTIGNSAIQDDGSSVLIGRETFITGTNAYFQVGNAAGATGKFQIESTSGAAIIGTRDDSSILFRTNLTTKLTLNSAGNLGLGVTPSAWASNYKSYQLPVVSIYGRTDDNDRGGITSNAFFGTSGFTYVNNGFATLYEFQNGDHRWHNAPSGTAGNAISFTQAMTLDASGRLGIGTPSPTQQLETTARFVIGNAVTGRVGIFGQNTATADTYITIQNTAGNFDIGTSSGGHYFYGIGSLPLQFYTNSTEKMRIFSDGNVFIGSSPSNAGFKLDINGTGRFSGDLLVKNTSTIARIDIEAPSANSKNIFFKSSGNADNSVRLAQNANTNDFIIATGDGTVTPTIRLTIASTGAATFSSSVTAGSFIRSGGTSSQYLMADGSVSTLSNPVTGTGTAGQVAYWSSSSAITGESNLFWDSTNDRLGIGRNNPSQKLDVLGSGTVYVNIENSNASFAAVITKNTSKTFSTGLVTDYWAVIDATSGSNTRLMITSGGNVLINTVTDVTDARLNVNGNIRTQNPTGGTAANWSLGTARGGTVTTNATVRVMIDGVLVDLVARYV